MATSPPPATPKPDSDVDGVSAHHVEIVWGAPSDEMLDAEARGDIILIEDIYQRSGTPPEAEPRPSGN